MSTGPLIPPGLEGSNVSSLEDILNVTPGANDTFIQTLRDAVLKEVERSVQERTEALWAKGKQVLNQAQQKHQEEVKRLMEEVAQCQERQTLLAKENERLREVLQSIVGKASNLAPVVPEALLSPSSTFAGTSPLPSDPETSNPSRPFTPSPYTPAVDFYPEVLLPEVPPLPFTTGAPGAPAPLSLAEALAAPPPQRTPVSLADSLAPVKDSSGSPESGHFTITITKTANEELGLDVSHEEDGKVGLRVDGLRPGVVEAWNQQCLASGQVEKAIRPGDKITQCNGLKGPSKILEECVSQQKLSLVIFREVATSPQTQMRADASEFVPGGV